MHADFFIGSDNNGKQKQIQESDPILRFWSNVQKTDTCWVWTAAKRRGYGQFLFNGKVHQAHRVAYQIVNGPIHKGCVIMHTCDNPSCVNPKHLLLGTQKENMLDMRKKGRAYMQKPISEAGQIAIVDAYKSGFKRLHIANYFNVHPTTVTRLLKRNGIPQEWQQLR